MTKHEENAALWDETHDPAAMLTANIGLVWYAARRHAKMMNRYHLLDDYDSAAATGFLLAFQARDWDHTLGKLSTFTQLWMMSTMQRTVDKIQGTYGINPSNAIVSGGRRGGGTMPVVGSLNYQKKHKDGEGDEFSELIPDPTQEHELDRVEEVIAAQQDVSRLSKILDTENRATLTDMLAHIKKYGTLNVAVWAKDVGMSANTIYNRVGVLNRVLRTLFPDMVMGSVALGSDQAWNKYVVRIENRRLDCRATE